ncbi:MAG TPA: MauE/DoxX family redox-associated membrane protein [Steroidobacteraceae bacterium]|nr:MauE/DoxX family redox-associated membrane protein [Steroidobacteraceae bacterium]
MQIDPAISWTIATSVAVLFAVAVSHKLRAWNEFRVVVGNYQLLPAMLVPVVAGLSIALEAGAAALLVVNATRVIGGLLSSGLLALYAGAMAVNLLRGRVNLDCGCLGPGRRQPIRWWMVTRNIAIAIVALLAAIQPTPRALDALDAVTIAGAVLSLAFLYTALNLLHATPRPLRSST